tara:strand:+ start:1533 stop:2105 length:573 start_codon:yes stop_codon:yes gene_type:complete
MILHASDLENVNNWIEKNSADPLQPDLTEVVSKRESVSLLLSMLDCFFPYMQQTEKLKDKPYFSDQISDDGLWEMKQIKDFDLPEDVRDVHISTWKPGAVVKPHVGPFKGVIRLHIGLVVPEGDCWLSLDNKKYYWKEGNVFCFDDTYLHHGKNNTKEDRVVLFVNLERQMKTQGNQNAIRKMLDDYMPS